jgi:hypothetical protein
MTAANVTIAPEPQQNGRVVFLRLSAPSLLSPENAQLSLTVRITNKETKALHLNKVTLSFSNPPAPPKSIAADLNIASGSSALWYHGAGDNVLLNVPTPSRLAIALKFDGFSDLSTSTFDLSAFDSPLPGSAYAFPARFSDLEPGEYWSGRSAGHGAAGGGVQLFGYDMGVVRYDEEGGFWTPFVPGGSPSKNEDYLIWGKPIVAMAGGVVQSFLDGEPTNPNPPQDLSPPGPVEGNHFYIQHGEALVTYAHLQAGTLNPELTKAGTPVVAGQQLGLAGNSGNSSAPHLHIHAIRGTQPWQGPPWPLPFRWMRAIDQTIFAPPDPLAPWDIVSAEGLPSVPSAIGGLLPLSQPRVRVPVAIDPLALILAAHVYIKLNLPYPPPIEVILEYTSSLSEAAARSRASLIGKLPEDMQRRVDAIARQMSTRR